MNNKCPFTKNVICEYKNTSDKMEYPCHDCKYYQAESVLDPPHNEGLLFPTAIVIGIMAVILGLIYIFGQMIR